MKISDIAIHQVPAIEHPMTLHDAAMLMQRTDTGVLPVFENGRLVGTLSERDFVLTSADSNVDTRGVWVSDVCNRHPIVCRENTQLRTALRLMQKNRQSWLLVSDCEGALKGLLSAMQLIDLLLQLVAEDADGPEPDDVRHIRGGAPPL